MHWAGGFGHTAGRLAGHGKLAIALGLLAGVAVGGRRGPPHPPGKSPPARARCRQTPTTRRPGRVGFGADRRSAAHLFVRQDSRAGWHWRLGLAAVPPGAPNSPVGSRARRSVASRSPSSPCNVATTRSIRSRSWRSASSVSSRLANSACRLATSSVARCSSRRSAASAASRVRDRGLQRGH